MLNKFVLPSVVSLTETICPRIRAKSLLKNTRSPLPLDERQSKTTLLKLHNRAIYTRENKTRLT